jgi:hypothetical protein
MEVNRMNRLLLLSAILIGGLFIPERSYAQSGGPYTIQRSVIAGGGGSSSGGDFTLQGTIGQGVVGAMGDTSYTLAGGFWPDFHRCFVDFEDFANFAQEWLLGGTGVPADLDHNGIVDLNDLLILAGYWLGPCSIQWPL